MSRKQKLKARDKVTDKMSRDGLIQHNAATGEDIRVSKRESDLNFGVDLDSEIDRQLGDNPPKLGKRLNEPAKTNVDESEIGKNKRKNRRITEKFAKNENVVQTDIFPSDAAKSEVQSAVQPTLASTPQSIVHFEQSEIHDNEDVPREEQIRRQPESPYNAEDNNTNSQSFQNIHDDTFRDNPNKTYFSGTKTVLTENQNAGKRSALKHESDGKLRFERDNKRVQVGNERQKDSQRQSKAQNFGLSEQSSEQSHSEDYGVYNACDAPNFNVVNANVDVDLVDFNSSFPLVEKPKDAVQSALKHSSSDKLHFEPLSADVNVDGQMRQTPKNKYNANQRSQFVSEGRQTGEILVESAFSESKSDSKSEWKIAIKVETADTLMGEIGAESSLRFDKAEIPIYAEKTDKPQKLNFTNEETLQIGGGSVIQPVQEESVKRRKSGKVNYTPNSDKKVDLIKTNLPDKKKVACSQVLEKIPAIKVKDDAKTIAITSVNVKNKLNFDNELLPQATDFKPAPPLRFARIASDSALRFGRSKMYQAEQENVAAEAVHKGELLFENSARLALRFNEKSKNSNAVKVKRKNAKKSMNEAYRKSLAENPNLKSNVFSRMAQKRKIKKEYAKAARETKKAAKRAKQAADVTGKGARIIGDVARRRPTTVAVILLVCLFSFCLVSVFSTFGSAGSGGLSGILSMSYLAEAAEIDGAELAYTEWETDLQIQIANVEQDYPGYDEYRYNIGDISHNPYELMAYLTASFQNFSFSSIESALRGLFDEQYKMSVTPSRETKYADPNDANGDGDYEPYDWHVLTISLATRSFSDFATAKLNSEQVAHYSTLMQSMGARQYLSNPFGETNWLPYVTSYYGYRLHPITGEKNYHKGVDIGFPTGTRILSGQDGIVSFAGYAGDYGNVVIIENNNGLVSKYAHCDTISVTVGQNVKIGDIIATVGNTGDSTVSHLHLEVLKDGQYLNPIYFAQTGSFGESGGSGEFGGNGGFDGTPSYGNPGQPMGDGSYAAMIAEGEKYLGYPYVWGGASPSTSFDCSGFVSWVLTHSGVKNVGRLTAQGLHNSSTPVSPSDAQPGDLIFFTKTYSTTNPVTHVGIYVGNGRMLHCGDPIQYTSIETSYWQSHFYSFGRN